MLHIINKSPFDRNSLDACLRVGDEGGAILLIEDGVYAAATGTVAEEKIKKALGQMKIYALGPDVEARGMADRVIAGVNLVDYEGFVDLVAEYPRVQSWL